MNPETPETAIISEPATNAAADVFVSETERLKYQLHEERIAKLEAQRANIELAFSKITSEIKAEHALFDTVKIAITKKYDLSAKDTFSYADGKVTRAAIPAA